MRAAIFWMALVALAGCSPAPVAQIPASVRQTAPAQPAAETSNLKIRTWTAGAFSVEAEFLSRIGANVKLRRVDNGREISVEVANLCDLDQRWLDEWASRIVPQHRPKETAVSVVEPPPPPSYFEPSHTEKVVEVKGYHRKDGTFVKPHTRSAPQRKE